jgi:aryl-alcohol dehydrogenase-like predicted oxidoreductase
MLIVDLSGSSGKEWLTQRKKGKTRMSVTHRRLGNHGVLVSNVCLGTMNFGWHTSEEDSFKIMDRALELGINFFDTADVYGWSVEHGHTEEIIGRWLAQGGGRRDAIVLATKVYNPVDRKANLPEVNSDGTSLSAYKIRKHCEGSLTRLQTDWIDLYQMHHIDHDCPWVGRNLAKLRRACKTRQSCLRRLEQFRGMGYRNCLPGGFETRPDGACQRTKSLPPRQPDD